MSKDTEHHLNPYSPSYKRNSHEDFQGLSFFPPESDDLSPVYSSASTYPLQDQVLSKPFVLDIQGLSNAEAVILEGITDSNQVHPKQTEGLDQSHPEPHQATSSDPGREEMDPDTSKPKQTHRGDSEYYQLESDSTFFRDGKRKIDFVLAYKVSNDEEVERKRKTFEKNLVANEGLELETEDSKFSQDGNTFFVKVHAPWEVLTRVAEILNLKMPVKAYEEELMTEDMFQCLTPLQRPFLLPEHLDKTEENYFTADFSRERQDMFIITDKATFFSNAQRALIVHELLLRTKYDEEDTSKFGIDRLLERNIYSAAFSLHDGPWHSPHSILAEGAINDRHLLKESWASYKRWYNYQPLDLIRNYFGEKVAIYFTWLGFYTAMLIPASIIGLIVFLYGLATMSKNVPSNEICDEAGSGGIVMCPMCDKRCNYWSLMSSCRYARITYLFDNWGTVVFSGLMSLWATMFLELWKRRQAEMRYDWDVADFEIDEHLRPDFEMRVTKRKVNPVTHQLEPYIPPYVKGLRRCASFASVLLMVACVVAAVFGVIMYRISVIAALYSSDSELIQTNAKIATTTTAALINLCIILLLNLVYTRVAHMLTNLEHCRTNSEYEDSFTFKMFLFQFINYYSSIFYIAFFKGRLAGRPGKYNYNLGGRVEECDPAGCLTELCIQLAVVMVGKQFMMSCKEFVLPIVKRLVQTRCMRKKNTDPSHLYTRWEQDYDQPVYNELGLFDEYLEMIIQFGFVTIFVAAFPIAPLFALINNIIEIRLDAYKFTVQVRRPVAFKANGIGVWYNILSGVTFLAVLSNAFIIGWTSDFVPKLVYTLGDVDSNRTLSGYVEWSLSTFDVSDFQEESIPELDITRGTKFENVTTCRYPDYRHPPGHEREYRYTRDYWHVFMARLAFVIVFEHLIFFITWLITYFIPDVPHQVKVLMLREKYLAKEARYSRAWETMHSEKQERKEQEKKQN